MKEVFPLCEQAERTREMMASLYQEIGHQLTSHETIRHNIHLNKTFSLLLSGRPLDLLITSVEEPLEFNVTIFHHLIWRCGASVLT